MKVLLLILASDSGELYTKLEAIWRTYMHSMPDQIEAYFYKADPKLASSHEFRGDTLYVKCPEALHSVALKLKLALQAFEPRFDEFDFIGRPNLSSFWIYSRYLDVLKDLPRIRCCAGVQNNRPVVFPSGSGFTITPDIARAICADPMKTPCQGGDDVAVGIVLTALGIQIRPTGRVILERETQWPSLETLVAPAHIFQVRVKHFTKRLELDVAMHTRLLSLFYPALVAP